MRGWLLKLLKKVQAQVICTTMVSWIIPIVRQSKTDSIHRQVMRPLRHGGSLHNVRDASLVCDLSQFLTAWRLVLSMKPWSYIWLEFGLFSTIIYIYILHMPGSARWLIILLGANAYGSVFIGFHLTCCWFGLRLWLWLCFFGVFFHIIFLQYFCVPDDVGVSLYLLSWMTFFLGFFCFVAANSDIVFKKRPVNVNGSSYHG